MSTPPQIHISMISAMGRNRVIGVSDGRMPWGDAIKDDLRFFSRQTRRKPMIMGRKTFANFDSLLPKRPHIVLTRNKDYTPHLPATIVHTPEDALAQAHTQLNTTDEIMVIGGGKIYDLFLPFATRIYLTEIEAEFDGDVLFPKLDKNIWEAVNQAPQAANERNLYPFTIMTYERKK